MAILNAQDMEFHRAVNEGQNPWKAERSIFDVRTKTEILADAYGLDDLAHAVGNLTGNDFQAARDAVPGFILSRDGVEPSLEESSWCAKAISEIFASYNPALASSWANVADVCMKINNKTKALMENFGAQIGKFIEESRSNENQIKQATTTANDIGNDILKELGL